MWLSLFKLLFSMNLKSKSPNDNLSVVRKPPLKYPIYLYSSASLFF
jgi:hypothetical protein